MQGLLAYAVGKCHQRIKEQERHLGQTPTHNIFLSSSPYGYNFGQHSYPSGVTALIVGGIMNIGNNIRELRLQEGLSLSSFGKEVNISPRVLSNIENSKEVKNKYIEKIERRYGIDLESFSIDLTNKSVGEIIQLYRIKKEYTRTDFARILGVHQTYICDIENGRRNPSASLLKKIAELLDVDIKILIDDKPNDEASIGDKVRYYRRLNGLTQEQLSAFLGATKTYISRVERNITVLTKERQTQLAEILSVNEKYL